jgi:hypothetical protein
VENVTGKTLKLREELTLVSIEDKAALLDVENRRYFDPNDPASFLLKRMENGCLYEDLMARLVSDFDAAEETAQVDVDDFVGELLMLGLVEVGEEGTARKAVCESRTEKRPYRAPQFQSLPVLVAYGVSAPSPE